MKTTILIAFFMTAVGASAQVKQKYLYVNLSDKSVALSPFYKVFGSSLDPALTLGGGIDYFQRGKSSVFQVAEVTAYSTKMVGNGLTLSTSLGYRFTTGKGFFTELMLGLGGSGFFPSRETFSLNDAGEYQELKPFHRLFGVPIDLAAGYKVRDYSVYLKYRFMIEGNYTDILPLLPTSLIGCGIRRDIKGS